MLTVNFTEFRKNASSIFTYVEEGETVQVLRHGKEIAEITPINTAVKNQPSWKQKKMKLIIPGLSLSKTIIDERKHSS